MSRDELQPDQHKALELLLGGEVLPSVARAVGVDRSTIWRWTQNPRFAEELRAARAARAHAVREAVTEGALGAARYLAGVVSDPKVSHAVRVKAAIALLDRAGCTPASGVSPVPMVDGVESWPDAERERQATARFDRTLTDLVDTFG